MDLGDAIGDALEQAYRGTRPDRFPPMPTPEALSPVDLLRTLKDTYGVTAAARTAGIDRRTFQRAINRGPDDKPYRPTFRVLDRLRAAYVPIQAAAEERRQARIRAARASVYATLTAHKQGTLRILGTVITSNDRRRRILNLSRVFTGGTKRRIVDAYLSGDLPRAEHEFNLGLSRDYLENPRPSASDMYVDNVEQIEWR